MLYIEPNQAESKINFKSRYENCIGGQLAAAGQRPILRKFKPSKRQKVLRNTPLRR